MDFASRRRLLAGLLLVLCALGLRAGAADDLAPSAFHLIMGMPAAAKNDVASPDAYLLKEPYFALSYNNTKGTPNWVSWYLNSDYIGDAPRRNRFVEDGLLPDEFKHVNHNDYTNTGFQRGHMCPHSDRAANKEMSYATFVMTNVVPQSSASNEGSWESLESYCRYLASEKSKDLFIVAGPIGTGGGGEMPKTHQQVRADLIASGKVAVPAKLFKVIMVVDNPNDASHPKTWVNENTRLIAIIMPNDMTVAWNNWPRYRVPVAQVEQETGFKFFPAVQDKTKDMKTKVDDEKIPRLPKVHGDQPPE